MKGIGILQKPQCIQSIVFLFVLVSTCLNAQSTDRKVIASAGRDAKNPSTVYQSIYYMTYTIGEPLIYMKSNPNYFLNNGFIQPIGISAISPPIVAIAEHQNPFKVYPNPFNQALIVSTESENLMEVKLQLIDQNGKLILEEMMKDQQLQMEIPTDCAPGIYWLNIYDINGTFIQQNKLVKTDIPIQVQNR